MVSLCLLLFGGDMPSRLRVQSAPDPFIMGENPRSDTLNNNVGNKDTNTKTVRSLAINLGIRNLVLLVAGQSNYTAVAPSAYSPTNGSALDNFNPYNGQMYAAVDPLLGAGVATPSGGF